MSRLKDFWTETRDPIVSSFGFVAAWVRMSVAYGKLVTLDTKDTPLSFREREPIRQDMKKAKEDCDKYYELFNKALGRGGKHQNETPKLPEQDSRLECRR